MEHLFTKYGGKHGDIFAHYPFIEIGITPHVVHVHLQRVGKFTLRIVGNHTGKDKVAVTGFPHQWKEIPPHHLEPTGVDGVVHHKGYVENVHGFNLMVMG